ncbi:23S rRNA (guanosine(2251)-2'-O)-methyltransferase RlmB [Candidatus Halobeggiatoa sp. HSG11]|nr:23S rRNA (guanosine(2251)-2'-O)-methyltransferase RlmB [Candidatus Halobeggiatoa sp. HSG11]
MKKDEQVFGIHAVRQVFENDISRVIEIWIQDNNKINDLLQQATQHDIVVHTVAKKTLDKLTNNGRHQNIVIRCKPISTKKTLEEIISKLTVPPFLLVLDEIQDPHNLGACLRTAEASGVHAVIVPENRACKLTATVRMVATGAAENIPLIQVTNLVRSLNWLKNQGIWLVGTDENGQEDIFETNLNGPLALVLGSEGNGLRRLTKETCDMTVRIPMLGKVKSLNVSVATGVCLYEAVRQRIKIK